MQTRKTESFRQYIGGDFLEGAKTFASVNPASGKAWAEMPAADEKQTAAAVCAARGAFSDWSSQTASARGRFLFRLAEIIGKRAGELAKLETRDTGKILRETEAQIGYVAEFYRYFAGLADKTAGAHLPIDKPDMEVWTRREAIGVVAAIVPWNSQLFLAAVKLGPALAAGCTIVVKASEDGAAPLLAFARLVDEAGFPPGTVNVVCGFGEDCGAPLVSHPDVARVAFTGGVATARRVVSGTAKNLAHLTTELGGKSPMIVFADADLESAANAIVAGVFAASGQSCVACSRLLAQNKIKRKLLARIKEKAEAIKIGDPEKLATEMGPLCTRRQLENAEESVARAAEKEGAKLICGGARANVGGKFAGGFYWRPTILDCPPEGVGAAREELFAPVLCAHGFESEADAVRMANGGKYNFACGVFTHSLTRAHRVARAVRAGVVWLNTYRAVSPIAPFGGFGLSGYGREGGAESVLDYTRTKTVWLRTSDEPMADPFVMR